MESPKVEKFIEEAVDFFLAKNRVQYLEILAKLEVEDQIKVLAKIGGLSGQIRQELESVLGKKEETAVVTAAPARQEFAGENATLRRLLSPDLSLEELGGIVKPLLKAKGVSMAETARTIGISPSHFCNILNSRTTASPHITSKIVSWAKEQLEQ